ncbi:hypothetical protein EMPG_11445 [Blastomyces silverae]|uniref:Uncharacterized protein n=1 Tax=Blastomyces silverae TaxID=2060906 RepID=A0A0H1BPY8_9EURO|nr:hypothetical protein EMPG_11445 [Blastomyces silverae]
MRQVLLFHSSGWTNWGVEEVPLKAMFQFELWRRSSFVVSLLGMGSFSSDHGWRFPASGPRHQHHKFGLSTVTVTFNRARCCINSYLTVNSWKTERC